MSDGELVRVTGVVPIDRSIFGVDEMRRPGEERPFWAELPVDGTPVRVGQGTAMICSNAQTHHVSAAIEIAPTPPNPGPEFEPLGEWPWVTGTGEQFLSNIDGGSVLEFRLRADSRYTLRVWRAGGGTADARFRELMGVVFPIDGLEEYVFAFTPADG